MSSYWLDSVKDKPSFGKLDKNIFSDVCIIGAGIFGLSSGYYLSKNGLKVSILDKNNIMEKVSGHTTAKITSQHNIIYKYLIDSVGLKQAKQYLDANEEAIYNIKNIVQSENIDCDFEMQDSYVYTTDDTEIKKIELENKAVNTLGFASELVSETPLPFKIKSAIKFPNQAQFNPVKYAYGLANKIIENSGEIYTNTTVYDVQQDGENFEIKTENNTIQSKYVIIATHYPFINAPGYYFLKMYQSTSYVICVDIGDKVFDGMYINTQSPIFSYRFANYNDKKILLVGGADHKTGSKIDLSHSYSILENEIRKFYPKCNVLYRWNTEDCITLDKIPYIGEFSNLMPNMYIGTGFNKWGMTSSNVAANIITNNILGKINNYEDVFKSTRFHPIKNSGEFGNMLKESTNSILLNKFKVPEKDLASVKNGTGEVLEINGEKIGVYKDENGKSFCVKPICTHLGCLLSWNNIDKTWDCPCHGSRFDYLGRNIYSPAIKDLEQVEIITDDTN